MDVMSSDVESVLFDDPMHPMSLEEDCWIDSQFFFLYCWEEAKREKLCKTPQRTSMLRGHMYVYELMSGLYPDTCYEVFRLERPNFCLLCDTLREGKYIKESKNVHVEEAVFIFLYVVCQKLGFRVAADRFQHSIETISRHFRRVMRALCRLGKTLLAPSHNTNVHPYVEYNPKYYPWFKDYIGAIDGTHVTAWAPAHTSSRYKNRKGRISQNVLAVCDFDARFTFIYSGWEGSAHDSRVFYDAVSRSENKFPLPLEGKFYLVDSGFPMMKGFMPPYKGSRYHLSCFSSGRGNPRSKKELFNYKHSSLRNIIERCFGMLKNRFSVLDIMPRYLPIRQPCVVTACCTLHNFCRIYQPSDSIFMEFNANEQNVAGEGGFRHDLTEVDVSPEEAREMGRKRDELANMMWNSRV